LATGATQAMVVLGGDRREAEAARILVARGYRVAHFYGVEAWPDGPSLPLVEALAHADAVLGPAVGTVGEGEALFRGAPLPPLPIEAAWLRATRRGTPWLVGRAGPWLVRAAAEAGVPLVPFAERADYAVLNAVPTAEGALAEATEMAGRTVWGARALVVGAGRCGEALATRLAAWGAEAVVAARGVEARARLRAHGVAAVGLEHLEDAAAGCAFAFNTVPAPLLGRRVLAALPAGAVVIDLASAPGGTDFAAAEAMGVRAVLLPGLPGRRYPVTAGRIVADTVEAVLRELGRPRPAAAAATEGRDRR
jgi:dipicolinate synthase subunit A